MKSRVIANPILVKYQVWMCHKGQNYQKATKPVASVLCKYAGGATYQQFTNLDNNTEEVDLGNLILFIFSMSVTK